MDRPIIFSGPMVRALAGGRKTQTRRLVTSPMAKCVAGDRLWVREAFASTYCFHISPDPIFVYRDEDNRTDYGGPWRPSIHMPRSASRLTLVVKDVRIERLHGITDDDARSEGCRCLPPDAEGEWWHVPGVEGSGGHTAAQSFSALWDCLHGGKPSEAWRDNPEVVALTFAVHRFNIDKMSVLSQAEINNLLEPALLAEAEEAMAESNP